ncbi:hypothetical protein IX51_04800 [uncultured archaeon]|nr:hypothetical protein IX51_04800 [uncultured archaeon]
MNVVTAIAAKVLPATTSGSGTSGLGMTIFNSIWKLVMGFLGGILDGVNLLMKDTFGGIGQAIMQVFQSWGFSVNSQFGVWAPVGLVLVLGVAGALIYVMFDAIGIEKDVLHGEEDI